MKYGTMESILCEERAKYLAQFPSIKEGLKALGRKPENKKEREMFEEVKRRMKYYRR